MNRPLLAYGGVALAAALADQWIKRIVVDTMDLHEAIEVAPFLALYHTRNTGIAFSFLSGLDDGLMLALTLVVIGFVAWLAAKSGPAQGFARLGFALIIGGAVGNLVDRALLGYVVDYVLVHTATWSFAVFNLADAFISVGAALVVLQEVVDWRRGSSGPPPGDG